MSFKLSLEQSTYGKYELGKRQPSLEVLEALAAYFEVTTDYLLGKTDNPKPIAGYSELKAAGAEVYEAGGAWISIPILGEIQAGLSGSPEHEPIGFETVQASMLRGSAKDYYFLRVRGDSMEPEIYEGDLVLIHRQQNIDRDGQLAAVWIGEDFATLKRVYMHNTRMELHPVNPSHKERVLVYDESDPYAAGVCGVVHYSMRRY